MAVSVDELIEEAEIAKNTFYTFFPSKEDLLSEIVRPVFERGIEELKRVHTQSPIDTARGIADAYLKLWHEDRNGLTVAKKLGMNHFSLIEDVHSKFSDVLREKLKTLQKSGDLRNDCELFSAQIIARSSILYLEVYSQGENLDEQFRTTIEGLLLKNPNT
jgi:AcrR family transcriptional regulator